jgi:anaerobic magnesium-protoporphyrin IX monomethyl ester cyclase
VSSYSAGKKILLVYPPTGRIVREDRCQQPIEHLPLAPLLPPTDLMYMAGVAELAGCICKIGDYGIDHASIAEFASDLRKFCPDWLVINVATPTLREDLEVCRAAKNINPRIVTVAKGAHFLTCAKETLELFPALDLIIRGEPEQTLQELVADKSRAQIPGLVWRDEASGRIIINADRPFNPQLDSLPYPARHLIDNQRYRRPDNGEVQAVINVSRGCPYDCFFCLATQVSGEKVRVRSSANIVGELRECVDKYHIRYFLFWSDLFNLDRGWACALCRAIIDSGLKITWAANTRADTMDEELARLMRRAGCRLVSMGVESGSQMVLNQMGKRINLEEVRKACDVLKQAGIQQYCYFVIGLPWDTEETVEQTIRFAIELDSDYAIFSSAVPFPGSRFYDYALKSGLLHPEAGNGFKEAYYYPVAKGHYLSQERIFELRKLAIRRFYLRPRYICKSALRIRSLTELGRYFRAAWAIVREG